MCRWGINCFNCLIEFHLGKIIEGDFELFWGPRAEVEFGSEGMDTFILGVFDVEEEVGEKIRVDLRRLSHVI